MKKGFTLAEVLVTLGIIGVVAALTTPALIQNVGNAKIPPRLQKAKATWEVAAEMLLNEENSNTITGVTMDAELLGRKMSKFMKITKTKHDENGNYDYNYYNGNNSINANHVEGTLGMRFDSDDGVIFYIPYLTNSNHVPEGVKNIPRNQKIGILVVDINGTQQPNVIGKDTFYFNLYNDGSLRPYGSKSANAVDVPNSKFHWDKDGHQEYQCNEDTVYDGKGCTGSIFDNGMKIIYQ